MCTGYIATREICAYIFVCFVCLPEFSTLEPRNAGRIHLFYVRSSYGARITNRKFLIFSNVLSSEALPLLFVSSQATRSGFVVRRLWQHTRDSATDQQSAVFL